MNLFTIKDLENLSGIKAHTIRIWEQRYSFLKPMRTETNIRYYTNEELKTILNVALLNKYGLKISRIDRMSGEELRQKILSLTDTEACNERTVNELIQAMIDLEIESFEKMLDECIAKSGIDKTIPDIIFPFLERIGLLWLTNHIQPAQEHLVTNIIRQKILVGIEGIATSYKSHNTVILFLPEGEYHELGLLYVNYLFRRQGVNTLYLGANVPLKDIEYVTKLKNPAYIYTHLTSILSNAHVEKFLKQLCQKLPAFPLIITGRLVKPSHSSIAPTITVKTSMQEMLRFIENL